ncbi:MAG TPA: hypothetical protein PLA68_12995 [Panacibacter sp.]|nr:hypothetical protein [Panacibacter sp.]
MKKINTQQKFNLERKTISRLNTVGLSVLKAGNNLAVANTITTGTISQWISCYQQCISFPPKCTSDII